MRIFSMDRFRDFASTFETSAFLRFKNSQLYKDAIALGADALPTKETVLGLLGQLAAAAANPDDPDCAALLSSPNAKMKEAWDAAVVAKGLDTADYAKLCAFKKSSNKGFHQPLTVVDALQQLESSMPLPEVCLPYKAPLVSLLKVLRSQPK